MRVWHSAWSWLKEMASADSVAGNTFTGMLTRLTLRKPFQVGRGGICTSLSVQSAHDCTGMHDQAVSREPLARLTVQLDTPKLSLPLPPDDRPDHHSLSRHGARRLWWDGCRLQGAGPEAFPDGCAEVPAHESAADTDCGGPLHARSAHGVIAQPPWHLHDL